MGLLYLLCYVLLLPVAALAAFFLCIQLIAGHFEREQNFIRGLWLLLKWMILILAEPLRHGWIPLGAVIVLIGGPVLLLAAGMTPTWRTHGFIALAGLGTLAILYIVAKSGGPKDAGEALFLLPSAVGIVLSGFMAYRQLR